MGDRQRVRTAVLMVLLGLSVPQSAIAKIPAAIVVRWRHPLVAFLRRGAGWVAVLVDPRPGGNQLFEHPFVYIDELVALLEVLWPLDGDGIDAILGEVEIADADQARALLDDVCRRLGAAMEEGDDGDQ